jgi:hypothetical protein
VKYLSRPIKLREVYVYRIKIKETGEYCKNKNNEPCECATLDWAELLLNNCKMHYPEKNLELIKEKYYVKC